MSTISELRRLLIAMQEADPGKWASYGDLAEAAYGNRSYARSLAVHWLPYLFWQEHLLFRAANEDGNTGPGWSKVDQQRPNFALIEALVEQVHAEVGLPARPHAGTPWPRSRRWRVDQLKALLNREEVA